MGNIYLEKLAEATEANDDRLLLRKYKPGVGPVIKDADKYLTSTRPRRAAVDAALPAAATTGTIGATLGILGGQGTIGRLRRAALWGGSLGGAHAGVSGALAHRAEKERGESKLDFVRDQLGRR